MAPGLSAPGARHDRAAEIAEEMNQMTPASVNILCPGWCRRRVDHITPARALHGCPRGGVVGTHVTSVSHLLFVEWSVNIHCWTILEQRSCLLLCHAVSPPHHNSSRETARGIASITPNDPFIVMRQVDNLK